jgi:hypothetical protein
MMEDKKIILYRKLSDKGTITLSIKSIKQLGIDFDKLRENDLKLTISKKGAFVEFKED